jgi:nucleoside-diphosphate-sugar epimerase
MYSGAPSAVRGPVFVTGGSGFIGSRLVDRLLADCVPVRCLQLPGDPSSIAAGAEALAGDLSDLDAVMSASAGARLVFHLGGIASAASAQQDPYGAFRANTLGTQNVMEAARRGGSDRVVILSTAHVYGAPANLPVTEDHPFAPVSVYAATKLAGDMLALACHRNLEVPVNVLRTFNVYGPGQRARAIIPTIVEQAVRGADVRVQDLRPRRDFVYVDDVVAALLAAAVSPAVGGQLILSSGRAVSVAALVRAAVSVASASGSAEVHEEDGGTGDCLFGSSERAWNVLGWKPEVDLAAGLERTVAWWREQVGRP